jgi:stage II sporulation protein D
LENKIESGINNIALLSVKLRETLCDSVVKRLIIVFIIFIAEPLFLNGQVRIRLFTSNDPSYAIFSVTAGQYEIDSYTGQQVILKNGELAMISEYDGKLAIKTRNTVAFRCDSVIFNGKTGNDSFTLRVNGKTPSRQFYSGDLQCIPDMETILLINICDIESYIAGVVKAEGGSNKSIEYFKTQAIIARTYMYKYFNKHIPDRYNLCDNTHCQAFNGITSDSLIKRASYETKGLVILGPDSTLVIAAFHSNCGGETSPAEFAWLIGEPYLKKVIDPWCRSSRNATWTKTISFDKWTNYLSNSGFVGNISDRSQFNFSPESRQNEYRAGTFSYPMRQMRTDLNLRSAFFTLSVVGDSVIFNGRGYGHGVGLCQEGAMVMAARGYTFSQIIGFYYSGVRIVDIKGVEVMK